MGGDHAGLALQSVIVRDSRGPSGHRSHLPRRSRSGHPRGRHYLAPARVAPEAGASPVGLLTVWPRFLPLGIWVTVLFLYARLARFEEHRLAERFGDDYLRWAKRRVSAWPEPEAWMANVFEAAVGDARVRERLEKAVETSPWWRRSPAEVWNEGMYYFRSPGRASAIEHGGQEMGVDPESVDEPVEVVLSRAEKAYRERLALDEAVDAGVR